MTSPEQVLAAGAHFGFGAYVSPHLTDTRGSGPPDRYRTFQIAAPRASHYRPASCEEYGCLDWRCGFEVHVQQLTELQQRVIRRRYRFTVEDRGPDQTWWRIAAGQPCFRSSDHVVPVGRPALFVVRRGDHRWSEVAHVHKTPEAWRDDAAEHTNRIVEAITKRG